LGTVKPEVDDDDDARTRVGLGEKGGLATADLEELL
jgi:hypothetical protein